MCASQNKLVYINYQTVKHSIYSNGDFDLCPNDPKINRYGIILNDRLMEILSNAALCPT
jgi:hypothetical protein